MASRTVVIGCRDAARAERLTRAVAARTMAGVITVAAMDQAIAAGAGSAESVVVLAGSVSAAVLRAMADAVSLHADLAVLVLGPLEPNLEALVALASGASGCLPSDTTPAEVAGAVEALLTGDAVLPRAVSVPLVQHLRSGGRGIVVTGHDGHTVALTNREWEVLVLLSQGRSTAEIARRLVVSTGTVRTHVAALVHKLGVGDRRALASPPSME